MIQWWTTPRPYHTGRLLVVLLAWIALTCATCGLVILEWSRPPATAPTRTGPP